MQICQNLLLVDSAPIIYFLQGHPKFAQRFKPLFEAHAQGCLRFAVTTVTVAEVLTGPLRVADEALARRFLESRQLVELDIDIAESAARLRASLDLNIRGCRAGSKRARRERRRTWDA